MASIRLLCVELHALLQTLAVNAAIAREDINAFVRTSVKRATLRANEIFRVGSIDAAEQCERFVEIINSHVATLYTTIDRIELSKRAAVEAELVAADNALDIGCNSTALRDGRWGRA
jgi:hypothetical protein